MIKRLLTAVLLALSSAAFAVTTVPVQLINSTGSSSGQAIVSTGSGSAPAWGGPSVTTLTGVTQYDVAVGGSPGLAFIGLGSSGTLFASNGTAAYPSFRSLASLGIAASGANGDITSLTGLTTPLGTWAGGLGANNSSANGVPVFASGAATVTATTGTGSPVLNTSPTITTPAIVGPTNGAAAAAGNVGEVICAQVTNGGSPTGCATNSSTPVSLSSGITANVTSITLTPGNWRIWGQVLTIPAGSTTQSYVAGALGPNSASFSGVKAQFVLPYAASAGSAVGGALGAMPVRVTTNTTYYLVVGSTFAVSTNAAIGFIVAQRTN